jgi:hypothetical protein
MNKKSTDETCLMRPWSISIGSNARYIDGKVVYSA